MCRELLGASTILSVMGQPGILWVGRILTSMAVRQKRPLEQRAVLTTVATVMGSVLPVVRVKPVLERAMVRV